MDYESVLFCNFAPLSGKKIQRSSVYHEGDLSLVITYFISKAVFTNVLDGQLCLDSLRTLPNDDHFLVWNSFNYFFIHIHVCKMQTVKKKQFPVLIHLIQPVPNR
ncbi:hypothetical protein T06_3977 [Trichinella sp. T6]|nr:hypothetical protein T06_3977 [Trichinella sp. T6]